MKAEKAEKKNTATEGLMWLLRGMYFTCKALQNAQANKSEELASAFSASYSATLKQFHNFIVKGVFSVKADAYGIFTLRLTPRLKVAMKACPYRADFYKKLAADPAGGPPASQEVLNAELDKWLAALSKIVTQMDDFYVKGGYGKVA